MNDYSTWQEKDTADSSYLEQYFEKIYLEENQKRKDKLLKPLGRSEILKYQEYEQHRNLGWDPSAEMNFDPKDTDLFEHIFQAQSSTYQLGKISELSDEQKAGFAEYSRRRTREEDAKQIDAIRRRKRRLLPVKIFVVLLVIWLLIGACNIFIFGPHSVKDLMSECPNGIRVDGIKFTTA